jgi:hypothetical protein
MAYIPRSNDAPGDKGRAVDQNASVGNDAYFYARRPYMIFVAFGPYSDISLGDDRIQLPCPGDIVGMNLVACRAIHKTAGAGGNPTLVQVRRLADAADMLSTRINIDVGETDSLTAAVAYVIDTTKDDVPAGTTLCIDIDQEPGTHPQGLVVVLEFANP